MADNEPLTTPKRKRGMETAITPIKFSFDPTRVKEDGSDSPRSKVAHRFRGLALEGEGEGGSDNEGEGSGVVSNDTGDTDDDDAVRKRQRADIDMEEVPQPAFVTVTDAEGKTVPQPEVADESKPAEVKLPEGSLQKAYPSINRLSDSKSRKGRKRAGTPPPRLRKKNAEAGAEAAGETDDVDIVDPVRAALTWREDEITIYDPEDADDDGTGINGVGFRPTPALAHARLMKRRQQMAEYRKREEREARAQRSERRRGQQQRLTPSPEQSPQCRKVRFMEEGSRHLATTS